MSKIITKICIIIFFFMLKCYSEKIRYIATERPAVTFIKKSEVAYFNLTSRRFSRSDPFYYVDIRSYIVHEFHNNVSVDFYFYEFLTNRYRRGFVEMHFKVCDLLEKDTFFGSALRQGELAKPCPHPSGVYNLSNMTIPIKYIPHNFPFTKGRIYCNISVTVTKEILVSAHVDMEIKETHINKRVDTKNNGTT